MNTITVTNRQQLDDLYKDSAFTIEGISESSLTDLLDWIKSYTKLNSETVYLIKGNIMNTQYNLTGDNAYNSDLNIACVKLSDMVNANALVLPRFQVRGRWFDDVVDNNSRREQSRH